MDYILLISDLVVPKEGPAPTNELGEPYLARSPDQNLCKLWGDIGAINNYY